MATYDFLLWSIGDLSSTGPDPFANDSDPNNSAPGNSTLTIGGTPSHVSIDDDDTNFQDGDNSQLVGGNQTDTEYSYVIRPVGSSDPADDINIYIVFEGSTLLGITSDGQLQLGATYDIISVESSGPSVAYSSLFVCYAPGTMIATPDCPRAVETLRPGDEVMTLDHGPQIIRWVHSGDHPLEQVEQDAKPVLIAAGALGRGLPTQDLVVSPQHRMLVGGGGQLDGWFETESFAPAKSLTTVQGIRHMKGKQKINWIHFACDRHEVVFANGCLSESLLLGPMVVNGLTSMERQALTDIFGSAQSPDAALNGPAARECLKVGEVRRHFDKCRKEKRRRIAKDIRKWDVDLAMEQYEAERLREAKSMNQTRSVVLGAA